MSPVTKQAFKHENTYPKDKDCRAMIAAALQRVTGIGKFVSVVLLMPQYCNSGKLAREPAVEFLRCGPVSASLHFNPFLPDLYEAPALKHSRQLTFKILILLYVYIVMYLCAYLIQGRQNGASNAPALSTHCTCPQLHKTLLTTNGLNYGKEK